jgi:hypothetical protein
MDHFIFFIEQEDEIPDLERRFPECQFTFVALVQYRDGIVLLHRNDFHKTVAQLEALHRQHPFQGVINIREKFVVPSARLSRALGLHTLIDNPLIARDKHLMLRTIGRKLRCARTLKLTGNSTRDVLKEVGRPCVIKPRFGVNSMCVVVVDDPQKLRSAVSKQKKLFARLTKEDFDGYDFDNKDFVVESLIGGTEHTVDSLIRDSKVILQIISDKLPMTSPYFIEMGDIMPSQLPANQRDQILGAVSRANKLIGMRNGWTHTEVKLWRGEPYIVETAARMGGGYFQRMIQEVYGIDRVGLLMDILKGEAIPPLGQPRKVVIGKRVVGYGINYVLGVRGLDRLKNLNDTSVVESQLNIHGRGMIVGPPYGYLNSLFEYFVFGKTVQQARSTLAETEQLIKVHAIPIPYSLFRIRNSSKNVLAGLLRPIPALYRKNSFLYGAMKSQPQQGD